MSEMIQPKQTESRCPNCGSELPRGLPPDLCPKCLLEAGFGTETPDLAATIRLSPDINPRLRGLPQPGEQFGHYKIIKLLGEGGMGVAFEAEDLDSQRRMALKILDGALDSIESRTRFLREGQLAASLNHPNSVYVFGTEEIAGTPVIAMELMAGGTLRDRVHREGPLPSASAVDAMLDVIMGLEAAARAGLLHRDVKPSNCFIDSEGTVKIGDFGLSINTAVRADLDTMGTGGLFGTPAFCSPEQLRGDALTIRSDIYAVGTTLYYLLTQRTPFEGSDLGHLLPLVLETRPESPGKWRKGIPEGLCRVVLCCLNKLPSERFVDYAALRQALLPYASTALRPATLGIRFTAGSADVVAVGCAAFILSNTQKSPDWKSSLAFYAIVAGYFAVSEGITGSSPGKAIMGLKVVSADGHRAGPLCIIVRSVTFVGLIMFGTDMVDLLFFGGAGDGPFDGLIAMVITFGLLGVTFSTARLRNAFAGIHDLLSKTRVAAKSAQKLRSSLPKASEIPEETAATGWVGPYQILGDLGPSGAATIQLGFDPRLLRQVWIRHTPQGTPPVRPDLRHLARPTRLRWLNGQRTATESWDAYEAKPGQPFLHLLSMKQDWAEVRFWLYDLARELELSNASKLSLDQVWITENGCAKLLDFPAPGTRPVAPQNSPRDFLGQFAASALEGKITNASDELTVPIPLHARHFVESLRVDSVGSSPATRLKPYLDRNVVITPARRLGLLACGVWFPVFLTLFALIVYPRHDVGLLRERQGALLLTWAYGGYVVMLPGLVAALFFREGALLRGFGMAIVNRDGKPASRFRVFCRSSLAFAPFFIIPRVAWQFGIHARWEWLMVLLLMLLAALAVFSACLRGRSLPDRLAGTWLVAR